MRIYPRQNEEKENRASELVIANKELLFQNKEKVMQIKGDIVQFYVKDTGIGIHPDHYDAILTDLSRPNNLFREGMRDQAWHLLSERGL